jgi:hypothetical protein
MLYVVTDPALFAGSIFNCWTALDSQGRRGAVYEDLDDEALAKLREKGYTVEQVDKSQVDERGF